MHVNVYALDDEEAGQIAKPAESKPDAVVESKPVPSEIVLRHSSRKSGQGGDVLVVGVDSLLTQLARCCRPVPPDAIAGFVTRGKGVSIHRRSCKTFRGLLERAPERVIQTVWTNSAIHDPANSD